MKPAIEGEKGGIEGEAANVGLNIVAGYLVF